MRFGWAEGKPRKEAELGTGKGIREMLESARNGGSSFGKQDDAMKQPRGVSKESGAAEWLKAGKAKRRRGKQGRLGACEKPNGRGIFYLANLCHLHLLAPHLLELLLLALPVTPLIARFIRVRVVIVWIRLIMIVAVVRAVVMRPMLVLVVAAVITRSTRVPMAFDVALPTKRKATIMEGEARRISVVLP